MSVLCIGEALVLLCPTAGYGLESAPTFEASIAGAELNVAVGLAALGRESRWAGMVGDDPFGARVIRVLGERGVGTELAHVVTGGQTGVYFKPGDAGPVRYYRRGSAAGQLSPALIDSWSATQRPSIVHVSGVSVQISGSACRAIRHVVDFRPFETATTSFDVNHRPSLHGPRTADDLLHAAQGSDIVFVGLDEASRLWGAKTAEQVRTLLSSPRWLIVKDAAAEAVEFHGNHVARVPAERVDVVEPTGAGDAFAAGWLHAFMGGEHADSRLAHGHAVAARVLRSRKDYVESEVIQGASA